MRVATRSGTATSRTNRCTTLLDEAIPARLADAEGSPVRKALDPHRRHAPWAGWADPLDRRSRHPPSAAMCPLLRREGASGGFGPAPVRDRPRRRPPPKGPRGPLRPPARGPRRDVVSRGPRPSRCPSFSSTWPRSSGSSSSRSPRLEGSARESSRSSSERTVANRDIRRRSWVPPQRGQTGFGSEIRMTRRLTVRRQSAQWYS